MFVAERAQDVVDEGQPDAGRELDALRVLPAGLDQHVDQQVGHQRRRQEVEHDGGDDDVAAALGLEIARDDAPDGAKGGRGDDGDRSTAQSGQLPSHRQTSAVPSPPDIGLALAARC